jgi:tRNA(Glu) U13 pseudouridine synthase TruD
VRLEFTLLRGSYATVLLRELMKPIDLIFAGF